MIRINFILSIFLFSIQLSYGQNQNEEALRKFNAFIGEERADAFQDAVDSFDQFLIENYPDSKDQTQRTISFLEQIADNNETDETWIDEHVTNQKIIESFESTGLRKEIWLYGYEEYESKHDFRKVLPQPTANDTSDIKDLGELNLDLIEEEIIPIGRIDPEEQTRIQKEQEERIRNFMGINGKGDYIYALLKYSPKESFVYEYALILQAENNISPAILANGFLFGSPDYGDPLVKRLLVTEFYYRLIIMK